MEKFKYSLFCAAVVAMAFMLANTSTASAVNINLITQNKTEKIKLDINQFLNRKLTTVEGENAKVDIGSSENSPIQAGLLYLCKDRNPIDCIKSLPIQYTSKADASLKLQDIQNNGIANLLSLIKTDKNWLADWTRIENSNVQATEDIEIDAYSPTNTTDAKEFMQKYGMLPLSFIDKVDFRGKKIYQTTGITKRKGSIENITLTNGKLVDGLEKEDGYIFAFPAEGDKIYSPITFYNIPKNCGDSVCSVGENHETCWYDCACPEGTAPSRFGCINKTGIKMIIDKKPDSLSCIVDGLKIDKKNLNTTCKAQPFNIKFHIENQPVKFSISPDSFYFEFNQRRDDSKPGTFKMSCLPPVIAQYRITKENLANTTAFTDSEYECFIAPPKMHDLAGTDFGDIDARSMLFGMYMNVPTKNGTQVIEISNTTNLDFKILGQDTSELEGLTKKAKEQEKIVKVLDDLTATVNTIFSFPKYLAALYGACYVSGKALIIAGSELIVVGKGLQLLGYILTETVIGYILFAGIGQIYVSTGTSILIAGEKLVDKCYLEFQNYAGATAVGEILAFLLGISVALCTGNAVPAPFFNAVLPQYAGGGWPGITAVTSEQNRKIGLTKEFRQGLLVLGGALYVIAILVIGLLVGGIPGLILALIPAAYAITVLIQAFMLCIDQSYLPDLLKQKIDTIESKKQAALREAFSNVIWIKGDKSGKSHTVCGEENVTGFYTMEGFGCSDDLGFSFNSRERPQCNFNKSAWANGFDKKILGETCRFENTTGYTWLTEKKGGELLGVRKYNSTGAHILFNTTAPNLFETGEEGESLSINVKCESKLSRTNIQSSFQLVNYTKNCGGKIV